MRAFTPLCSAILIAMACTNTQAMSLTQAIQSTLDTHPELNASRNSRLSADEDVKVAKGGFYPSLDLNAAYGRGYSDNSTTRARGGNHHTETDNYTQSELRLRQMLFDGFNTSNEVQRTGAVVNSRAYYTRGTAESLALRTERGIGSTADRDQSTARRALADNNYQTALVDLQDAESNFYSVVGRMPDELESPASIKGELPSDQLGARRSMLENNPYLKSAQSDVMAAESQYEVAKSPFYPRFDAEAAVGANNNVQGDLGHDNEWRVGVVMNYNLFRGGSDKARLASDSHKINQAMDIRNNALRMLNENLNLAWHAMDNARIQTPTAREYAETTQRVRAAYQDQFGLGQRTLLDLLDSENELYNANRRYTEVRYTEEFSMYRVLANMGELLRKENVVMPAESIAQTEVKSDARLPEMK